ncbi:MAG: riboflavin synthase [Methylophilaceae bacterium]
MFTGIIQATGQIDALERTGDDLKLVINAKNLGLADVNEGDSIAVNGVCLTATAITSSHFAAHVSKETLGVTTSLDGNSNVNLEKALRLGDRLGGHLVSGHVDGVGKVTRFEGLGNCWLLAIEAPSVLSKYIAKKGSICVDGVSLTVNTVVRNTFTINIIPHTLQNTTLANLKIGDNVNLEIDQTARYLERLAEWTLENN